MYKVKKKLPIALQLYSLRDDAQRDLAATLALVKGMGYDGIELAGLYGRTAGEMRVALEAAGLRAISAHVPYLEIMEDIDGVIGQYAEIGCEYVAIPYLNEEYRPGADGFDQVLANIRKIGEACNKQGMKLLYHNHDFEFIRLADGRCGLDAIYEDISAQLLETEIDTCWVKVAGVDPAQYLSKYSGRAPVVHLKDFNLQGALDFTPYELIGLRSSGSKDFSDIFSFRAVGEGMQDFPSIIDASIDAGAQWLVVELDAPAPNSTAAIDVKKSIDYLKTLGL